MQKNQDFSLFLADFDKKTIKFAGFLHKIVPFGETKLLNDLYCFDNYVSYLWEGDNPLKHGG